MSGPTQKNMEWFNRSWSPKEDDLLKRLVEEHGEGNWSFLSKFIPDRSASSCRFRWLTQLSPEVVHSPFTPEEDETILRAQAEHGNKWATISRLLNGRTDNAIKNHWHSRLKRKCRPEGQICDSGGNEGCDGNLDDEPPSKRTANGGDISEQLSGQFVYKPSNRSGFAAEVTTSSTGGDPSTYLSWSLPWSETLQVNESTQLDQNPVIDNGSGYEAELFPVKEKEEETKGVSGYSGEFMKMVKEMIRKEVRSCMADLPEMIRKEVWSYMDDLQRRDIGR